jgi:signal peptidase I
MGADLPGGAVSDEAAGQMPRPLAAPLPASRPRRILREPLDALLVALLLAVFTRCFLVQAFRIPTASMEPSLQVGDHLLVNKFVYAPTRYTWERRLLPLRDPRRGEVAVFRFPGQARRDFVKRVIGEPGARLALHRKRLTIDGAPLVEAAYVRHADRRAYPDSPLLDDFFRRRDNLPPFTVPAGTYFVLGDNRDLSEDSRFWGSVPRDHMRGRALLVYWSTEPPGTTAAAGTTLADRGEALAERLARLRLVR